MLQQVIALGKEYHDATKHSYFSVLVDPNYVDASTQPNAFKIYPHFYRRFPLESGNATHDFIRLTSTVTFKKTYRNDAYYLRVNPSAGALYPTEIYVQIRGVKGWIYGIYHLEVATDSLTLIYELIDDGIESYLFRDRLVKGFIFLVSCAYFRSSWKYKNRSLRYCFLDSGHHLGAIEASSYVSQRNLRVIFDFDKQSLNQVLGFENKEFITAAAICGELKEKSVRQLRSPIPFVAATDYFEANTFVEAGYQKTIKPDSEFIATNDIEKCSIGYDSWSGNNLRSEVLLESILSRRSARCFKKQFISENELEQIWQYLQQPLPTNSDEEVEIYLVINRVRGKESGLYRGLHPLKLGDFSEKAKYLCLNQALGRDSAVTFFFVSAYDNYQTAMQYAGWLGQRLYLMSNYLNISCSGIGAYYDDETQEFLETTKDILYAIAIGR